MPKENRRIDGLRVALEMERRGRNLYRRAQEIIKAPDFLILLQELEEDEARHYSQFQAMMEVFCIPARSPEEEMVAQAKAAEFFFPGGLMQAEMEGALQSPEALLDEAIQSERDSIAFYGRLLAEVEDDQQEIVIRIIREEINHLRRLTEKKQEVRSEK